MSVVSPGIQSTLWDSFIYRYLTERPECLVKVVNQDADDGHGNGSPGLVIVSITMFLLLS